MEDAAGAEPAEADSVAFECPHFGARVEAASAADDHVVYCRGCGAAFAGGGGGSAADAADALDYADPATPADRRGDFTEELDGLRIRQISTLRRGTSRARSYLVIGVIVTVVGAMKLLLATIEYVREGGWGLTPVGYLLFVGVLLMLAGYFARRGLELHRQLQVPAPLPPVEGEPDFSTLSDGSQHWKNLEDIR